MAADPPKIESSFVIVLGPPGAGKSTVVRALLRAHAGFDRFVVRHQLAEERRLGTDLWRAVGPYAERGAWIPDALVIELFMRRLARHRCGAMLLEGLPANGDQAAMLRDALDAHGVAGRVVLYLDAPDEVCVRRLHHRMVCARCDDGMAPALGAPTAPDRCRTCGAPRTRRDDDTEVVFIERLRIHRRNIPAILAAFPPAQVAVVDATGPPAATIGAAARAVLAGADQSGSL